MGFKRNRRKFARYGVGSLRAGLHCQRLLGLFSDQMDVTPIDFNATGMAFRHSRFVSPGQPIVFDLAKDQLKIQSVIGVVRYCEQLENHFRCGVKFDFEANEHMRSQHLQDILLALEKVLNEVVILAAEQ